MIEPTTAAGREHVAAWADVADMADATVAIEQEAVAKYREALAARVRAGAADDLFIGCGGYGCTGERNDDYTRVLALIGEDAPPAAPLDEKRLERALIEVEEQKISTHPEFLTDECDHDECPDWGALGCGDAAAILAALREQP